MSVPSDTFKSATAETIPESPTTARPLEMDDDDAQETGITSVEEFAPKTTPSPLATSTMADTTGTSQEVPPPKPPRPVTEAQKNIQMLKEAFPSIDEAVIKAVLTASGGRVEPAFNALLEMTDPEAAAQIQDDVPPPPPPRPAADPSPGPTSTALSQLEADELYARQLAEHYEIMSARAASGHDQRRAMPRGRQQTGLTPNESLERERSFLDDDLPVIRENLRKGFVETQSKVNTWFTNLKKRIDDQFDDGAQDDEHLSGTGRQGGSSSFMGRPSRDPNNRRSADYERYDADPELLSDDFAGMKFQADGTPVQNRRPAANPNLFQPPPPSRSPKHADGRKVAFREEVEDIDAYNASPKLAATPSSINTSVGPSSGSKASKWQPLSTVDPSPVAENDPFSLGDSEDEKDVATPGGSGGRRPSGGIKMEDAERLKQGVGEAMSESLVEGSSSAGGGEKKTVVDGAEATTAGDAKKD